MTSRAATEIPVEGIVLYPNRLYLGETLEVIGSERHACELYGCLSVAALGIWIQVSAPLGHTGAIVRWTLEIRVAQPVRVRAGLRIGKVAFWSVAGRLTRYTGRYADSRMVTQSRLEPAMILSGQQITLERQAGRIVIDPFDETAVNPNSYNFTLSDLLVVYADGRAGRRPAEPYRAAADSGRTACG